MCSVDGGKIGWAPPSYLKKCEKNSDGDSDSDDEYIGFPESCKPPPGCIHLRIRRIHLVSFTYLIYVVDIPNLACLVHTFMQ